MAKKFTFNLSSADKSAELGDGNFYDGDVPPKGVYLTTIKLIRIKTNKNDDPMLNVLTEIAEPKSSAKSKYNGYGIWNNINVTPQSAAFVNNFLDSVDPSGKMKSAFYDDKVLTDDENPPNLVKVGGKKILGLSVRVSAREDNYNGEERLAVGRYIESSQEVEEADDASDEDLSSEDLDEGPDEVDNEEVEDQYTRAELEELDRDDLTDILSDWDIDYPERAGKKKLIDLILAQYDEDIEEVEDDGDDEDDEVLYTEEDLADMGINELKEIIKENEWTMPKPPIRKKLIASILHDQAETPF